LIVLQAKNISKYFGDKQILKSVTLAINEKERVGLVGANGTGKTTLLNCISGQIEPDGGEIIKAAALSFAYMQQLPQYPEQETITVWDAVMLSFAGLLELRVRISELEEQISRGGPELARVMDRYAALMEEYERNNGYSCENTARRILVGLGFRSEDFQRPLTEFSGGQKTRINLGRLLALSPDILLLDEPTNHLDMESVEWLEEFLKDYPGTLLIVSHDRWFLDKIASRVVELKHAKLKSYPGNYTNYLKLKEAAEEAEQKAFDKQQEHIQETEEYILRFKAGIKSRQARGRQKQLDRMERIEKPHEAAKMGDWNIPIQCESGYDVLQVRGISKSFGDLELFRQLDFDIYKGEKAALVGANGCGKTTLLKIINGMVPTDAGTVRMGSMVKIAYFAQQYEDLNPSNTLLEEILSNSNITIGKARDLLGRMLFRGDDVFKMVGDLSGGEKGRLAILKLFLSGANFLILDEPTNHLDIESRQAVEDMLLEYPATVLFVSHDRYLIDKVARRVLAVKDNGLLSYPGNYTYYAEKRQQLEKAISEQENQVNKQLSEQQKFRQKQKEAERERRMLDTRLKKLEDKISLLEVKKNDLEELMVSPEVYNDQQKGKMVMAEYEQVKRELTASYEEWETIIEQIDEFADAE